MFLGADGQAVERPRGFAVLAEIVVEFFGPSKGTFREKFVNAIGLCVHFATARHLVKHIIVHISICTV